MATIQTADDIFGVAALIVDPTAGSGTHTTITAALAVATSGQTIFIRPGTYTENPALVAGVNLTAFGSDSSLNNTGNVKIIGKCTFSSAGTVTISGIELQTNSDNLLAVTGSAASIVNLNNCYLNFSNNAGISHTTSNASSLINMNNCWGNIATTGIALIISTSTGNCIFDYCNITNTGLSTTSSTISTGRIGIFNSRIFSPFTTSSVGGVDTNNSYIDCSVINTTCITTAGTGGGVEFKSYFASGSQPCLSIGSGTLVSCQNITADSTNTNAITGLGQINYALIDFPNTSSLINTSTQSRKNISTGGISFDGGNNTLSIFTQGTFTPTLTGSTSTGTIGYTTQIGRYQKVGRLVTCYINIVWTSVGTSTGNLRISSYPFTFVNTASTQPVNSWGPTATALATGAGTCPLITGTVNSTDATVQSYSGTTGANTALTISITTSGSLSQTITYEV